MASHKNILLGVTGSIAAYKAAYIIRLFIKEKYAIKTIVTPSALEFVTPLTLSTLSKNPIFHTFFEEKSGEWISHVDLVNWADIFLIAPATANTIAKMVHGICDNLLLATYLSATCPVIVAPAMDLNMHNHPATKKNIELLKERRNIIIPSVSGELASGLLGEGRMAEPEDIVNFVLENDFK